MSQWSSCCPRRSEHWQNLLCCLMMAATITSTKTTTITNNEMAIPFQFREFSVSSASSWKRKKLPRLAMNQASNQKRDQKLRGLDQTAWKVGAPYVIDLSQFPLDHSFKPIKAHFYSTTWIGESGKTSCATKQPTNQPPHHLKLRLKQLDDSDVSQIMTPNGYHF